MSKVGGQRRAAEAPHPGTGSSTQFLEMINLIPPEGVTDKEQTYLARLRRDARESVRHLLASGAGEADVADYIASQGPEPEDEIATPQGEPPVGQKGFPSGPPRQRPEPPAVQKERPAAARQARSQTSAPPDRIPKRRRGQLAAESYEGPPGVQGANVGYWQAGGVTRAGAKRSKRP